MICFLMYIKHQKGLRNNKILKEEQNFLKSPSLRSTMRKTKLNFPKPFILPINFSLILPNLTSKSIVLERRHINHWPFAATSDQWINNGSTNHRLKLFFM